MAPFPLAISSLLSKPLEILVYFLIGLAFGYVLEISGFGNSKKLAAQFYFKELTVLKVMFTAIVVAMVLVFAASALGLLDYNMVWVNPTYLWPGIVGGLIMGVGFIIGGFCPGTSLVSAATFKLDGLFFVLGGLFGIFVFGETVGLFENFWNSSYMGRFTIPDWLGIPTGWVVFLVVLMALFMFWGGEQLERIIGKKDLRKEPRSRFVGAGALTLAAVLVMVIGQPSTADRWQRIAPEKEQLLTSRAIQIHPGELLATMHEHKLRLIMLDVRDEVEYNLFHLKNAQRVDRTDLIGLSEELRLEPANTVIVIMSNGENRAAEAWKTLVAESVQNVYILEGGINNWLNTFVSDELDCIDTIAVAPPALGDIKVAAKVMFDKTPCIHRDSSTADDQLEFHIPAALGDKFPVAYPDPDKFELEYTPKIQLQEKKGPTGGGCG